MMTLHAPVITTGQGGGITFDLFRLSKAKEIVDLAPNTLRHYNAAGLNFYRQGKAVFVSRAELEVFIRTPRTGKGSVQS
jgi:hypothetical protein